MEQQTGHYMYEMFGKVNPLLVFLQHFLRLLLKNCVNQILRI